MRRSPTRILQRRKATQIESRSTCYIALARCLQRTAGLGRCYHQEIVVAAMAHRAVRCPWLADKELSLAFQRLSRSVLHRTQAASLVLLLPFACGHAEKTDGVRAWCCQCHIALGGGLTQAPSNRTRPRAALQRARRGPRGMWGARPAAAPLPSSLPLQLSPTKNPSEKGCRCLFFSTILPVVALRTELFRNTTVADDPIGLVLDPSRVGAR